VTLRNKLGLWLFGTAIGVWAVSIGVYWAAMDKPYEYQYLVLVDSRYLALNDVAAFLGHSGLKGIAKSGNLLEVTGEGVESQDVTMSIAQETQAWLRGSVARGFMVDYRGQAELAAGAYQAARIRWEEGAASEQERQLLLGVVLQRLAALETVQALLRDQDTAIEFVGDIEIISTKIPFRTFLFGGIGSTIVLWLGVVWWAFSGRKEDGET